MDTAFLDWALADFSGYVAADELYDGPFCVLSAVDNRCYKRILYDVLDHDPTHDDIRAFLRRLQTALAARGLTLLGMTTDGSPLYPTPLAEVFSGVPHQLCQFHVIQDIVKAVVKAVASERKRLAAQQPKLPRGRPRTKAAKQAARAAPLGPKILVDSAPPTPEPTAKQAFENLFASEAGGSESEADQPAETSAEPAAEDVGGDRVGRPAGAGGP